MGENAISFLILYVFMFFIQVFIQKCFNVLNV